jgi:hypothetical protein
MDSSRQHLPEYDSLLTELTSKIQSDLPAWYGANARLAGAPEMQPREWSFFIRYLVQISETQTKAILVKIRRNGSEMYIGEAIASSRLKDESKDEYDLLVKMKSVYQTEGDGLFFAINPLGRYDKLNALVIEEADIRPLKAYFKGPGTWLGRNRRRFETLLEYSGRWLRIYHDCMGEAQEGAFFSNTLHEEAGKKLAHIERSYASLNLDDARNLLASVFRKYQGETLPYRPLHDDFNGANVFVTRDGKVCSLDPKNSVGPVYIDLAKFMTDLETGRNQVITNGMYAPSHLLKKFNLALLRGYSTQQSMNGAALDLYRILAIIDKWQENETKVERLMVKPLTPAYFATLQMRRYFSHLLRRRVDNFQIRYL